MRFREGKLRFFNHDPSGPHDVRPIIDHVLITGTPTGLSGSSTTLTATAYDVQGVAIPGVSVSWRSDLTRIATVTLLGVVTFGDVGNTMITATVDGRDYAAPVTSQPATPQQYAVAIEAVSDFRFTALYLAGANQSFAVDAGSPTGYSTTSWDDCLHPGLGRNWRLRTDQGITRWPCYPVGGTAGTGGELPAANSAALTNTQTDDPDGDSVNALPSGLLEAFLDRSHGITIGVLARFNSNMRILSYDPSDPLHDFSATHIFTGDDDVGDPTVVALKTDGSGYVGGSSFSFLRWHRVKATAGRSAGTNWQWYVRDRCMFPSPATQAGITFDPTVGHRYLLNAYSGGPQTDASCGALAIVYGTGVMNAAATKLMKDFLVTYAAAHWPGMSVYDDTRPYAFLEYGDSYTQQGGANAITAGGVLEGTDNSGAPAIPNCAYLGNMSVAGNSVNTWQYQQSIFMLRNADLSQKTWLPTFLSEWWNGSSEQENKDWAAIVKGWNPKILPFGANPDLGQFGAPLGANNSQTKPTIIANIEQYATLGIWSDVLLEWQGQAFDARFWGNGLDNSLDTTNGKQLPYWIPNTAGHPGRFYMDWRSGLIRAVVMDILFAKTANAIYSSAALPYQVLPLNDEADLSAGSPTFTPTWTVTNRAGTALGGRTLVFVSSDPTIATVNGSTGLITRVAGGKCFVRARSDLGARGAVLVLSSSTTVADTFTRADSASTLGNAESGQAWSVLSGTWGIAADQAYYVSGGTNNDLYAVVDSGVSDTTVQVTFAVYDSVGEPRLCWRATDVNNLWIVSPGGTSTIYKRVAGSYTSVTTFVHTWTNGDVVSVILSGNTHTVQVNGTTVATVTDAFNATATKHGIGQFQGGFLTNRFDNFSVL